MLQNMRSNNSSKSERMSSRTIDKQLQTNNAQQKYSSQKSNGIVQQSDPNKIGFKGIVKLKDVDQQIFGDQKMKIKCHNTAQNYPIRHRIAIHRKDRVSKNNFIEDKAKKKTTLQQTARADPPPFSQKNQQKENLEKITVRSNSPLYINRQQDNKNQISETSFSNELTQRYIHTAFSAVRPRKHFNTSMQIYSDLNQFLKPTAFSIELKKPVQHEDRGRSPQRERMNKTINCSYKNQNQSSQKVNNFLKRQFSFRTAAQKKVENINFVQKQKFLLNGWEVESSMFQDFDQLYRQQSKELQKLPMDKRHNVFKRKIVRLSAQ